MKNLWLVIAILLLVSCGKKNPGEPKNKTYSVRLDVRGFVGRVDIDYNDGRSARQTYNYDGSDLPWSSAFSATSGQTVSVKARIRTGLSSGGQDVSFVSTQIHLDGELWKFSPTVKGQGATAELSEKLP